MDVKIIGVCAKQTFAYMWRKRLVCQDISAALQHFIMKLFCLTFYIFFK